MRATRGRSERAGSYRRLVVPVVDEPASHTALDVACRLAAERGASIVVVSALVLPAALPLDAHLVSQEADARAFLESAEATVASFGVHAVARLVRARAAGGAIVDEARAAGADLIVLGATRKILRSTGALVFGNTVQQVLSSAPCRVLVVAAAPERIAPDVHGAGAADVAA